jgi:sortase A
VELTSTATQTHSAVVSAEGSLGELELSFDRMLKPTPRPVVTPYPDEYSPTRLVIPSIALDAEVVMADPVEQTINGQPVLSWGVPDFKAAGWHIGSAPLGFPGNTVLNGHHNIVGEVFRHLEKLEPGAEVVAYAGDKAHHYAVTEMHILRDKNESIEVQTQNAQWVMPTNDERLTLVTCWPYTNNTHRLIVVALPKRPTPTPKLIRE